AVRVGEGDGEHPVEALAALAELAAVAPVPPQADGHLDRDGRRLGQAPLEGGAQVQVLQPDAPDPARLVRPGERGPGPLRERTEADGMRLAYEMSIRTLVE